MGFIIDEKVIEKMDLYNQIMDNIKTQNVSNNEKFQKVYNKYYGLNVSTDDTYKEKYYQYMEEIKNKKDISYEKVIRSLKEKTGRVDYSFASKLLHTINQEMPILDKHLMRLLGFALKERGTDDERIAYYIDVHKTVKEEYDMIRNNYSSGMVPNKAIYKALKEFDNVYSNNKNLSVAKKIDCILFRMRKERGASMLDV